MTDLAIQLDHVVKGFGRHRVLRGVSLAVPAGQTFAFLGRNGAGKTTTIRLMLGLLRADAGTVRVLGLDPAKQPLEVRRRVGYLAEDQQMFGWMKVSQVIDFVAPFYPTWDAGLVRSLTERFELARTAKVKHLSKGQSVRLGLLLALAHRPRLAILDDPALGLDPIMRKEFLRDVVTHLQGNETTVFFSSHLLYEVEPVADAVAILDKGVVLRQTETEALRENAKRLLLPTESEAEWLPGLPGVLDLRRDGRWTAVVVEHAAAALDFLRARGYADSPLDPGPSSLRVIDLNLDEIFEAYVIGRRHPAVAETAAVPSGAVA